MVFSLQGFTKEFVIMQQDGIGVEYTGRRVGNYRILGLLSLYRKEGFARVWNSGLETLHQQLWWDELCRNKNCLQEVIYVVQEFPYQKAPLQKDRISHFWSISSADSSHSCWLSYLLVWSYQLHSKMGILILTCYNNCPGQDHGQPDPHAGHCHHLCQYSAVLTSHPVLQDDWHLALLLHEPDGDLPHLPHLPTVCGEEGK